MKDLQIIQNDDGVFDVYDDTYDITIHCTSQEEQDNVLEKLNREECSDAISRTEALANAHSMGVMIDADEDDGSYYIKNPKYKSFDIVEAEVIKALPPVTPAEKVGQWIPVSERLPELNRPLLVTAYHRVYYGHLISESGNYGYPIFRIHGLGDKNRDWVQETMSHEPYSLGRIDAWMYFNIPEPYKASPTGEEVE